MFLKIVGFCIALAASQSACAQGAPVDRWQVNIGGLSYHMPHTPHNEVNWGVGGEYQWTKSIALQLGAYENSGYRVSKYAFVQYHPFEFTGVRFGLTGGVVDGYPAHDGRFSPMILPSFSKQWEHVGINGFLVPPGILGKKEGVFFIGVKFPLEDIIKLVR
jgi:hypothetical protein